MSEASEIKSKKGPLTIFYRLSVVFFILGTFIQIPFTYFGVVYVSHLKHASLDAICALEKKTKEHFGWSLEGDVNESQ